MSGVVVIWPSQKHIEVGIAGANLAGRNCGDCIACRDAAEANESTTVCKQNRKEMFHR